MARCWFFGVKKAASKYLFSERLNRFVRRLVPRDAPKPPDSPTYEETEPLSQSIDDLFEVDETIDASLYAIYKFHLFDADDPRVDSTMRAVEQKLWVKTRVGGVARYENDYYHRVSNDVASVPGNPWFICTLWLADYFITRAKSIPELKRALPIFEWAAGHAGPRPDTARTAAGSARPAPAPGSSVARSRTRSIRARGRGPTRAWRRGSRRSRPTDPPIR